MKNISFFFLALSFIFNITIGKAQDCAFENMVVEITSCNDDIFSIVVDFEINGNTNNTFSLAGNGNNYGSYAYGELPITLSDLTTNCDQTYELVAYDDGGNCSIAIAFTPDCCNDCNLTNFNFSGECFEGVMEQYFINFDYNNTSNYFDITTTNGINETYNYNELPLEVSAFEGELLIIDHEDPSCTISYYFESIPRLFMEATVTSCENGFYSILVGVETENQGSYLLFLDDEYLGTYSTQDQVILGPFPQTHDEVILWAKSVENQFCDYQVQLDFENCSGEQECINPSPCDFSPLQITKQPCQTDGHFLIEISNTTSQSDVVEAYNIYGNGHHYGTYKSSDLPVLLGPFCADCETEWSFIIQKHGFESCFQQEYIGVVCCDNLECSISEAEFYDIECASSHTVDMSINFDYSNMPSDSFNVVTYIDNIEYKWTFPYLDLPIRIMDFKTNGGFHQVVSLADALQGDCINTYMVEFPDCSEFTCFVSGMAYNIVAAGPNSFKLALNDVYISDPSINSSFIIKMNQVSFTQILDLDDLPITLGPFECLDDYLAIHIGAGASYEECGIDIINWMNNCGENYQEGNPLSNLRAYVPMGGNQIIIENDGFEIANSSIEIYNTAGKLMKNYNDVNLNKTKVKLLLPELMAGMYFVNIRSDLHHMPLKFLIQN